MNDSNVVELHDAHVQAYTRELACNIMKLAMEVSSPDYSVFVEWTPHVDGLSVHIHNEGWKRDHRPEQSYTVYLDQDEAHKKLLNISRLIEKWNPATK